MNIQQLELETGIYRIRRLRNEEFHLYKSIRLEAIQSEPATFRCTTQ